MTLLFISLTILHIIIYFLIVNNERILNLKNLFLFFVVFLYLLIPIVDQLYFNRNISILYYIIVFCSISSILIGYIISNKFKLLPIKKRIYFPEKKENKFLVFILLLSFIFLYMYASAFGGFYDALIKGISLRYSGATIKVSGGALALYFIAFAKIVGAVFFYKLISSSNTIFKQKSIIVLFIMSSLIILIYGLINASRGAVVLYILLLIYLYLYNYFQKNKISSLRLIKLFLIFITFIMFLSFFIFYGKSFIKHTSDIFKGVEYGFSIKKYKKSTDEKVERIIKEFSHPYKSLNMQIEEDVAFTYFEHFILAPVHLIPIRFLNLEKKPDRITEYNTFKLIGTEKGGIPPGIFASFWYNGGFFILVLCSLLYGIFISYIQKYLEKTISYNSFLRPYVLYLYFTIPWHSFNGDPSIVLKSNIYLLLFVCLFILFILKDRYLFVFKKGLN